MEKALSRNYKIVFGLLLNYLLISEIESTWFTILAMLRRTLINKMSSLNINSTLLMNSGFEIPALGYGVSQFMVSFIIVEVLLTAKRSIKRMLLAMSLRVQKLMTI